MSRLRSYTKKRPPIAGDDVVTFAQSSKGRVELYYAFIIHEVDVLGVPGLVKVESIGFSSGIPMGIFGFLNSGQLKRVV